MSHIETLQLEDRDHDWVEVERMNSGMVDIVRHFRTRHPKHRIDGTARYHTDMDGEVTAISIHTFQGEQLLPVLNPAPVREYFQS